MTYITFDSMSILYDYQIYNLYYTQKYKYVPEYYCVVEVKLFKTASVILILLLCSYRFTFAYINLIYYMAVLIVYIIRCANIGANIN